ncbi:MAG: hypothetical protein AB2814_01990, partial [Candidatus Sedimenticola endophacoides]
PIMRLKSRYIMHLEHYPFQKPPTNFSDEANNEDSISSKLTDAMTPGYQAEFDPEEAERAGAFVEDAISEQDASESDADLIDATVPEA